MARLFFALRPAEDAVQALGALAGGVVAATGGRAVPAANVHLTLAFLGEVDAAAQAEAERIASGVRGECFSLALDHLGSFRRARVAWAGASTAPPQLLALQASLERGLREAGFDLEERPFKPHVTLARKIEAPPREQPIERVAWRVTDFVLMRTEPGAARYASVRAWALD